MAMPTAAPGPKYKAALSAAYAAGLSVSEVVALKVSDIDSERLLLRIEQGKGRMLPMTTRQFNRAVHAAAGMAGIKKPVTSHTLRTVLPPTCSSRIPMFTERRQRPVFIFSTKAWMSLRRSSALVMPFARAISSNASPRSRGTSVLTWTTGDRLLVTICARLVLAGHRLRIVHCRGDEFIEVDVLDVECLAQMRAARAQQPREHNHSITSSARASSDGGTVRPSDLAVLRLIANCTWSAPAPEDRPASRP